MCNIHYIVCLQGKFAVNMDRIPILEVDGTFQLGQSKCIEKYVSKKFGFYGDSLEEECKIDMICEHVRDIKQKLNDAKAGKSGEEATAAKTKFITEELPGWFAKLEKTLGGDKFAVGSKISLADVTIHAFVEDTADDKAAMSAAASGCPKVTGITANVAAAAKAWFDKRPVTAF